MVRHMIKQMAEKIDKVRQIAGNQLQEIMLKGKDKLDLPEKDLLNLVFIDPMVEEAKTLSASIKGEASGVLLPAPGGTQNTHTSC